MVPRQDLLQTIRQNYAIDPWTRANKSKVRRQQDMYTVANEIVVSDNKDIKAQIIFLPHASPYAGHRGRKKTLGAIEQTFWWPKMYLDVKRYVDTCNACQRNKHTNIKPAGLLQPLQLPSRRWEHVTMDFITHLPKSSRHHDAIMVFVGKLSKFVRSAPTTTDVSSVDAAHIFVDRMVSLFGLPKKVITDRDTRFTSNMFIELCRLFGIQNAFSTAFPPRQTDRQRDTMLSLKTCSDTMWAQTRPIGTSCCSRLKLRSMSKNDSTGETPAFLMQGQHPLTPVTIQTDSTVPSARLYANQLQKTIRQVQDNLRKAQDRQQKYDDTRRRDVRYTPEDMVLLSSKNLTFQQWAQEKFCPSILGHFQ